MRESAVDKKNFQSLLWETVVLIQHLKLKSKHWLILHLKDYKKQQYGWSTN